METGFPSFIWKLSSLIFSLANSRMLIKTWILQAAITTLRHLSQACLRLGTRVREDYQRNSWSMHRGSQTSKPHQVSQHQKSQPCVSFRTVEFTYSYVVIFSLNLLDLRTCTYWYFSFITAFSLFLHGDMYIWSRIRGRLEQAAPMLLNSFVFLHYSWSFHAFVDPSLMIYLCCISAVNWENKLFLIWFDLVP